jgi:DNA repair ATPase RecN
MDNINAIAAFNESLQRTLPGFNESVQRMLVKLSSIETTLENNAQRFSEDHAKLDGICDKIADLQRDMLRMENKMDVRINDVKREVEARIDSIDRTIAKYSVIASLVMGVAITVVSKIIGGLIN